MALTNTTPLTPSGPRRLKGCPFLKHQPPLLPMYPGSTPYALRAQLVRILPVPAAIHAPGVHILDTATPITIPEKDYQTTWLDGSTTPLRTPVPVGAFGDW